MDISREKLILIFAVNVFFIAGVTMFWMTQRKYKMNDSKSQKTIGSLVDEHKILPHAVLMSDKMDKLLLLWVNDKGGSTDAYEVDLDLSSLPVTKKDVVISSSPPISEERVLIIPTPQGWKSPVIPMQTLIQN